MAKYLLTEDQEGKSGYIFWKTLMSELFPEITVVSKQNNRGVLKAVKNIKNDDGISISLHLISLLIMIRLSVKQESFYHMQKINPMFI